MTITERCESYRVAWERAAELQRKGYVPRVCFDGRGWNVMGTTLADGRQHRMSNGMVAILVFLATFIAGICFMFLVAWFFDKTTEETQYRAALILCVFLIALICYLLYDLYA